MKIFLVALLISFGPELYSQNISKMETCNEEIKLKCKGIPFQKCVKERKLSTNCKEALAVITESKNYVGNNCSEILSICKFEKRTKNGPSTTERVKKFQKCVRERRDLFSQSCKDFIKKAQSPGGKREELDKALEH